MSPSTIARFTPFIFGGTYNVNPLHVNDPSAQLFIVNDDEYVALIVARAHDLSPIHVILHE